NWRKQLPRRWSHDSSISLVSVGYSNDFAHEQRIADGPIEFARLMAGASAVITNFFHGCIFAILHRKPWAAVPSDYRAIKIPDLAATVGAERHVLHEPASHSTFESLLATPVRSGVESRIGELRARSEAYLDA